jgi:pSer/pThr/pTyr-binding forkhead associated (FHA) protein
MTMPTDLNATKRLCANGHLMDPAWEVCPYCPSDRKSGPELARTLRIEDVAAAAPAPAAPAARKTELLERPVTLAGLGWLVAAHGAQRGVTHRIDRDRVSVGAARDCDIVLEEPHVSEHHASIRFREREFVVTDLDSTNGTFVNGESVNQRTLADGDVLRFGSSDWVFKCLVFEAP